MSKNYYAVDQKLFSFTAVRKIASIIIIAVFITSHTEVHQLFKLPVLFQHFWEHKAENPSITFIEFLRLHYDKIVIDDDYQRDQQLPFRDVADCALVFSVISEEPPQSIKLEQQISMLSPVKLYAKDNSAYSHNFYSRIFQPPRIS